MVAYNNASVGVDQSCTNAFSDASLSGATVPSGDDMFRRNGLNSESQVVHRRVLTGVTYEKQKKHKDVSFHSARPCGACYNRPVWRKQYRYEHKDKRNRTSAIADSSQPTNSPSTGAASPALSAEEQQAQTQADQAKQTIDAWADLTPYEKQLEYLKVAPITKPDIEEPLWKGSQEQFKVFKIKITPDGYVPDAIVVLKGDSVQLDFFSEKDTDVESKDLKFFIPVPANTITNVSYLTNDTGTLAFYCLNQCLGKERIFGNVEVRPRQ